MTVFPASRIRVWALFVLTLAFAASAGAQLVVYDDALQNGFENWSYGGGSDFASTAQAHSGTKSIALTGNNFNAVSLSRPAPDVSTVTTPILKFWVHGGAAGGQQLRIYLQLNDAQVASQELDTYIAGGGLAAGVWRQVTINLADPPFSVATFDRIDLESDAAGSQPVLYIDDVVVEPAPAATVPTMTIENNVTVASMVSDRFTWRDSANQPRVAVLAHNVGNLVSGARGGALREFRYQLPDGSTRIATVTTYGNAGYGGFGYAVSHAHNSTCIGDDSPLGMMFAGTFQRVFEGRHHAIFRFQQNYPRNCSTTMPVVARTIPITIDWVFRTGSDNPLWAITWDVEAGAPVNTFWDDSRAPYGELNIDGDGWTGLDGVAWGDRYKFTSTTAPLSVDSEWTWDDENTVPYVKLWLAGPLVLPEKKKDATMGLVQSQTMTDQDAGGGRHDDGYDVRDFWTKTSADGDAGPGYKMPLVDEWPYQANGFSIAFGGQNNARLTWGTQYGFLGQQTYAVNDNLMPPAPGYPKKSYSLFVVLGTHTSSPVEAQITQVEAVQDAALTATIGSVVTTGPAGTNRADTVTYQPAGYNHVYGGLAFAASGNQLDANVALAAGKTLKKPLFIISNYTGGDPAVTFAGALLTADADYFASVRAAASELWLTLNRDLSGAVNRLEISSGAGAGIPTGVTAAAVTTTRIDVAWNAVGGALSYQVDRKAPGGAFVQIGTPGGNSLSDTTAAAGTAYLYRVRAVTGAGPSGNSASDLATTIFFTDDPLVIGATAVKAVHLAQLRTAVSAVRSLAGLGAAAYTDAAAGGTTIKGLHVTELRTALDAALGALTLPVTAYTDGALAGVAVKAVHFSELRSRVQ